MVTALTCAQHSVSCTSAGLYPTLYGTRWSRAGQPRGPSRQQPVICGPGSASRLQPAPSPRPCSTAHTSLWPCQTCNDWPVSWLQHLPTLFPQPKGVAADPSLTKDAQHATLPGRQAGGGSSRESTRLRLHGHQRFSLASCISRGRIPAAAVRTSLQQLLGLHGWEASGAEIGSPTSWSSHWYMSRRS